MPELPDLTIWLEAIDRHLLGARLTEARLLSPFLLRTVAPPLTALAGRVLERTSRLGKRLVLTFEGELHVVLHLMIAGRLRLLSPEARPPARISLLSLRFPTSALLVTEAGTKRRASLHVVEGEAALRAHDPGGLEVLGASSEAFAEALAREDRTLKRALTDPRLIAGIGNSYSDEILHAARLSPMRRTRHLQPAELHHLHRCAVETLTRFTDRLRAEVGEGFPEKVTAFRPDMAVHGRFGLPCPDCGAPVQRVVYAENEMNYCARCQNEDRLLADRALSRLLKQDWPKTLDDLESLRGR